MIRVLIVDDDKLARKGLISIVPWNSCGMEVVGEAANGAKALEFLQENPVDLAVVDLAMPVMTGLEFIEESRKRWPGLQYVVLSFHEDFQHVQSALRLGTVDYISKMRLEQTDCAEVFRRVGLLLRKRKDGAPQVLQEEREELGCDGSEWDVVQKHWLEFWWLYTDQAMEEAVGLTLDKGPAPRQMEHLLVRLRETAAEVFGCDTLPGIPSITAVEQGVEWLEGFRQTLVGEVSRREDYHDISMCMLRAIAYVRENISRPLHMELVAKQVCLSRSYFSASFKKITGMTFNSFLRKERVRIAKRLLEEGRVSAGEVAQEVGYEDAKYFAHVFAEQTGLSPLEYRGQFAYKAE